VKIEIVKNEYSADWHPDETQLLLALERELPPAEIAAVEQHIGSCWDCRARYHEMHRGILSFVEYRDKLYLPEFEPAPHEFRQFPSLLNKADREGRRVGLLERIGNRIRSLGRIPISRPVRWASAAAAIMAAVLLWTQVLSPTTLSASEFLVKAAQSQNPPQGSHRKVRQKVRVKSGEGQTVREFEWETGSPIPGAKWGTDPENWTTPMTAEGFSQWHDSLTDPKDRVKKSADRWTLHTLAGAGPIKEAWLVIHTGDFHPIEQHIRFSDERTVDLEEVSFEMVEQPHAKSFAPQVRSSAPPVAPQPQAEPAEPAANLPVINLDEAELGLRYEMFVKHLDDEDLEVSRSADAVVVSGIASSAERLQELQTALGGISGVRLSLSAPNSAAAGTAPPPPPQRRANGPPAPLLKDLLDTAFASGEARGHFVDDCLANADSALSHAFALKKLAERYTDAGRNALNAESQTKLDQMLRGHLGQIVASSAALNGLLNLLPASQLSPIKTPGGWSPGVAALFDLIQQQDSLVAAMVAGTQNSYTLAAASGRLRAGHEAIARLADELMRH
jgi:hypothetical protein